VHIPCVSQNGIHHQSQKACADSDQYGCLSLLHVFQNVQGDGSSGDALGAASDDTCPTFVFSTLGGEYSMM
jgi:hypothetical protein